MDAQVAGSHIGQWRLGVSRHRRVVVLVNGPSSLAESLRGGLRTVTEHGEVSDCHDVPGAGGLDQRVLRVAPGGTVGAFAGIPASPFFSSLLLPTPAGEPQRVDAWRSEGKLCRIQ